jgi:hypothetical protein
VAAARDADRGQPAHSRDSVFFAVKDDIITRRGKDAKTIVKVAAALRLRQPRVTGRPHGQLAAVNGSRNLTSWRQRPYKVTGSSQGNPVCAILEFQQITRPPKPTRAR